MEMFLDFWQSWPVFVTALVTLGVTVYAFLPSQKSPTAAMIYQVVTVMSFILALPAVLINPLLGLDLFQIADPSVEVAILWLNLLGGLVALLSFLLSILGIGQAHLSTAGQPFVNAPLGGQHQVPTPQSFHSAGQSALPSVRFTGPLSQAGGHGTSHANSYDTSHADGSRTSHAGEDLTDLVSPDPESVTSASIPSHQVSTLDDSASQPYTEFTSLAPSAAPTPVRLVTNIDQHEPENSTVLLQQPAQTGPSSMFAWLVALNGPHRGQPYALTRHRNIIGRANAKASHIALTDKTVSSQHAAILRNDEQQVFMLHDLRSSNGTHLHGQAITSPQPLKDKDRIRVGETDFHFMEVRLDELLPDYKPPTPAEAEQTVIIT